MRVSNPVEPRRTHVRDAFVSIYLYILLFGYLQANHRLMLATPFKFIVIDGKNDVFDVYILLSLSRPPTDE